MERSSSESGIKVADAVFRVMGARAHPWVSSTHLAGRGDFVILKKPVEGIELRQLAEGVDRITKIVSAMRDFSHPGIKEMAPTDLNRAIETAATVARNEWKYVADRVLELDPEMPPVYELTFETKEDVGTTFIVRLPLVEALEM